MIFDIIPSSSVITLSQTIKISVKLNKPCFSAGEIICKLQISLLSLGASLTITTILGRAVRIIRIFTATNVTIETFLVSLKHQAFFISGIVLLQTGLAVLATAGLVDLTFLLQLHYSPFYYNRFLTVKRTRRPKNSCRQDFSRCKL